MTKSCLALFLIFAASVASADGQSVGAIGGNCKAKAEQAVREKFDVSSSMGLNDVGADGDEAFTFGFSHANSDCLFMYDVKIRATHTIPGKDELGQPTLEAVACDVLDVSKSSDPEDCG